MKRRKFNIINFHAATRKITSSRFHTLLLYYGRLSVGSCVCVFARRTWQRIFAMKSAQFVKRNNERRFGGPKLISRERTHKHTRYLAAYEWMNEWMNWRMNDCMRASNVWMQCTARRDGEREKARVLKSTIIALSGYKFCECMRFLMD